MTTSQIPIRSPVLTVLPPPPDDQTLIIHAEAESLTVAVNDHIHLRLETNERDTILNPGGDVWVYFYKEGELSQAKPRPRAQAAFSGVLTALNHTQKHPRNPGIPAAWQDATFIIEPVSQVYKLLKPSEMGPLVMTQSVIRIQKKESPDVIWIKNPEQPTSLHESIPHTLYPVKPDFRSCFMLSSVQGDQLLRKPLARRKLIYRVTSEDAARLDPRAIQIKLRLPRNSEVQVAAEEQVSFLREHIYLADHSI